LKLPEHDKFLRPAQRQELAACAILVSHGAGSVLSPRILIVSLPRVIRLKRPDQGSTRCVAAISTGRRLTRWRMTLPSFQARFYEDRYPIGRFILDRANTLGITRRDLVNRLGGFRDLVKGHRALTELMLTGKVPPFFLKLAGALQVDASIIDSVLLATARQQDAEAATVALQREEAYRTAFRPHLQVQTERHIPSPIFIAALMTVERLRIVRLPDEIASVEQDERHQIVRAAITKNYRDNAGQVPAFGRITGYILVQVAGYNRLDYGIPYDRDGMQIGSMVSVRRLPDATLGVKKGDARLTGLLKNEPIKVISVGHE
jgi:hypothetical protein